MLFWLSSEWVTLWGALVYADCFEQKATLAAGSRSTSASHPNYLREFELEALPAGDYQR